MKKKQKNELTYIEHLEELRYRIIFCLAFFVLILIIAFLNINKLLVFFEKPLENLNLTLYFFKPYEKIVGYFNIAIFVSFLLTIPVIFVQFMIFIYPALIGKEKIVFWFFFIFSPIFFIFSFLFSYFIILPISYNFLINFSINDGIKPMIGFLSHINMIVTILLSTILIFQLPLILIILIGVRIINVNLLKKLRRFIIVIIFIIAAIVTPPDIFSQIALAIPLYLLFEFTIIAGTIIERILYNKNLKKDNDSKIVD